MFRILTKVNNLKLPILLFYIALLLLMFVLNIPVEAQRDEGTVAGIWTFDDGTANDTSPQNLNGIVVGKPESVNGIAKKALKFNGTSDGIKIPDSNRINTGGPFPKRTIAALFNCDDVNKGKKQVIFEEGGRTRGLVIYVFDGKVYVGGWNRAEYTWNGEWLSTDIKSNRWYHVGLVIRDAAGKVEKDKFEMWLDGKLIDKADGGQLHAHGDDNAIGFVNQNAVYHDDGGGGTNIDWFDGLIDEVVVYSSSFIRGDFGELIQSLSVEPQGKFTTTWASLKAQRTRN
ncbi:hypothetical protein J4G08_06710 [Candidatus Poribacteria bacterium]|nr:hypothetical protein [Candidatus Poribacteria bacterium]